MNNHIILIVFPNLSATIVDFSIPLTQVPKVMGKYSNLGVSQSVPFQILFHIHKNIIHRPTPANRDLTTTTTNTKIMTKIFAHKVQIMDKFKNNEFVGYYTHGCN